MPTHSTNQTWTRASNHQSQLTPNQTAAAKLWGYATNTRMRWSKLESVRKLFVSSTFPPSAVSHKKMSASPPYPTTEVIPTPFTLSQANACRTPTCSSQVPFSLTHTAYIPHAHGVLLDVKLDNDKIACRKRNGIGALAYQMQTDWDELINMGSTSFRWTGAVVVNPSKKMCFNGVWN